MKITLSSRFVTVSLIALFVYSMPIVSQAQTWTFRNGFGQSGDANSISDEGRAICTDAAGNVYITGKINDDLDEHRTVSFGGAPLVSAGDDDGFVAKFNAAGVHQWSMRFGGTAFVDIGNGIATDGASVYVVGTVNGLMTVGNSGSEYPAVGAGNDGVIMKLNAGTGAVDWVTRFGGSQFDEAQAVCLDAVGNVYVSGIFSTRDGVGTNTATFGTFLRTVQGSTTSYTTDMFVACLNSSGVFQWVSTGGIAGGNDNISGSGICYIPGSDEVVMVGSMRSKGTTVATYSTTSPASNIVLNNSDASVNEDFVLLEIAASTGAFLTGSSAGSGDGNEAGYGVTYDPFTGSVFFAGSFSSGSVTFPGMPPVTNGAPPHDNILYGRYNHFTDSYVWVKDADNGAATSATDVARAITTNGFGRVIITGRFNNTITFQGGLPAITSEAKTDIFVARVDVNTGNADYVIQGRGTNTGADDIGYGIAGSSSGAFWITGVYATSTTFGTLAPLSSAGSKEDIVLASFADAPSVTAHPLAVSRCLAVPSLFTVTAGGANLNYTWEEATNASFTTGLVTLSNFGVYSGVNTSILTISDNSALNGRFYRARVSNAGGSVNSNGAQLTVQLPTLAANSTTTQTVTSNNMFYAPGAGCALISRVVPSGTIPVTGSVTSQVWTESAVPVADADPFVQRHYQIVPATDAAIVTGTVTLYFTQQEFDNFNAHAASILDLPTGPTDAAGKANLRVGKYPGTSNDGTGLPLSYSSDAVVIDPPDANIVFNSTLNRWEVTLDVAGFSGFVVQTKPTPLPVNLLSFSALWTNNEVRLQWKTAGEWEHKHFEVERSSDGSAWSVIGQVAGRNGAATQEYSFADASASGDRLFYRLKMVSISGEITYSKTVVVVRNSTGSLITAVLPNPFTHSLSFGINAPQSGKMNVSITDMMGRRLVLRSMFIEKGFSTQTIGNLQHLSKGIYTLVIDFNGQLSSYKVVK